MQNDTYPPAPSHPQPCSPIPFPPQSIILGGAAYFGFLPKLLELCGEAAAAAWLQSVQLTPVGLLGYGLLVACLEFLPLGGINPKEMAEYFNMVRAGIGGRGEGGVVGAVGSDWRGRGSGQGGVPRGCCDWS